MPSKNKGIHTSPENAGRQNIPQTHIEKYKDGEHTMAKVMPVYLHGNTMRENYKGLWTDELLFQEIVNYFSFCEETDSKPCKVGIRLWLGVTRDTFCEWEKNPNGRYGLKSDIIRDAVDSIEISYIQRSEKYPTANIFLLKTSHGHVESNRLDVTTDGKPVTNPDNISDIVKRLGLDAGTAQIESKDE